MSIQIPIQILKQINQHGEQAYPEEGAGLMLGQDDNGFRRVTTLFFLDNARESTARHNRYLITAEDMFKGEKEAERLGLTILGIFHSHPDHPNQPSEFDREYAIPWYSYLITSVSKGQAVESKSWRLTDDRSAFLSEEIVK
ncbi:MAG: M67 family metallopeptidase [Anaerolineales bacterium]|nr:M67 family metallopeptidase [Anaerolineales bacterium]